MKTQSEGEAPAERVSQGAAADHRANYPAFVALCCGLASFIPWVILLTLPLAIVFGIVGLARSVRLPDREGRSAALLGIVIAIAAAVLQLALAGLAALIGLILG